MAKEKKKPLKFYCLLFVGFQLMKITIFQNRALRTGKVDYCMENMNALVVLCCKFLTVYEHLSWNSIVTKWLLNKLLFHCVYHVSYTKCKNDFLILYEIVDTNFII